MRILIAHNRSVSCDAAVEDMRRAGLPEAAEALVLCAAGDLSRPSFDLGETRPRDSWKTKLNASEALAEAAGKHIQAYFPQWELSSEAVAGSPVEVILNTSRWWRPDLLIIGSDTFAPERSMASNVSLEVAHRARCSVRLSRASLPSATGSLQLVIGNAGSKECEAVIHEVARRRWPENTGAHVISVVGEQERDRLRGATENPVSGLRRAGLTVSQRFIDGDPHQELVREAERCNADTIFIGPRCLSEIKRFLLGSVATAVLTRARSTVEVVRQPS